ncbi:MAG: SAV_6107 family HEPN domain-containing protein [Actinomycetales bacterium]
MSVSLYTGSSCTGRDLDRMPVRTHPAWVPCAGDRGPDAGRPGPGTGAGRPGWSGPTGRAGYPPVMVSAAQLLRRCEESLRAAERLTDPAQRYCAAHLAAIRAAAAVLAVRGRPRRGSGALNVWEVLPRVAPELREWAVFYSDSAVRRAAVEAGRSIVVTQRDADDLCRQTEGFARLVAQELGLLGLTA